MQDADPAALARMIKLDQAGGDHRMEFCTALITLDEAAKAGTGSGAEALPRPPAPAVAFRTTRRIRTSFLKLIPKRLGL